MKSSLTRITCEALAKMLNLPDGVTIDAAFQDAEDLKSDTVSFRMRGAGDERPEGGQIKYEPAFPRANRIVVSQETFDKLREAQAAIEREFGATPKPPSLDNIERA